MAMTVGRCTICKWTCRSDFRLEEQKLLSGHLHLEWARGGERIVLDRWGLANMLLKKFYARRLVPQQRPCSAEIPDIGRRAYGAWTRKPALFGRAALMEQSCAPCGTRKYPCGVSRPAMKAASGTVTTPIKSMHVQMLHQKHTNGLWEDVVSRCVCHRPDKHRVRFEQSRRASREASINHDRAAEK